MGLLRILFKLSYNIALGGLALIIINIIGGSLGFQITLNILTAMIAGFLGLPGIVLIVMLQNMF